MPFSPTAPGIFAKVCVGSVSDINDCSAAVCAGNSFPHPMEIRVISDCAATPVRVFTEYVYILVDTNPIGPTLFARTFTMVTPSDSALESTAHEYPNASPNSAPVCEDADAVDEYVRVQRALTGARARPACAVGATVGTDVGARILKSTDDENG